MKSIKDWSDDDRPREKLLLKGASVLSNAELIAIIIGSGSRKESAVELSKNILGAYNHRFSELNQLSIKQLMNFNGIGEAKAISIMAALEIGKRRSFEKKKEQIKISSSIEIFDILKPIYFDLIHEEFHITLLNRANIVISTHCISKGGIHGTVADPKIIFKKALIENCSGMILSHNHPSGNTNPSQSDLALTKKIVKAGKLLDITILDHLIITNEKYYSFADHNQMTF
jgi:DNA repair protein RadC